MYALPSLIIILDEWFHLDWDAVSAAVCAAVSAADNFDNLHDKPEREMKDFYLSVDCLDSEKKSPPIL